MFVEQYDIAVCGGGIAGCAAALAAARRGFRTVMIEKTILPGGLATGGLVLVYLPLCDGQGRQVTFGLAEELMRAANKYGPADIPADWKEQRLKVYFSPASYVLALDELLTESGVDIWFDTQIIGAAVAAGRVESVKVANKSGLGEIRARVFIDATGDADIAHFAGHSCLYGDNAMVSWFIEYRESQNSSPYTFGEHVSTRIMADSIVSSYTAPGINGRMVSDFVLEGRRRYRECLQREYNAQTATRKTHYPLLLPGVAPLRHTRCIRGQTVLQPGLDGIPAMDSIGLAADWRCDGKVWEIPYSSLIPAGLDGLIAAGRCTSAYGDAWEITRVIPAAAMTGEVAGVAAALAVKHGLNPARLPYEILAAELRGNCGFPLKFAEAGLSIHAPEGVL